MIANNLILTIINNSNIYPVSISDVKEVLKLEHDDEDKVIEDLIDFASKYAENYLGKSITKKTILATYHYINKPVIELKYSPIAKINQVSIYSISGNSKILNPSYYQHRGDFILLHEISQIPRIDVNYDTDICKSPDIDFIRQGIITHAAYLYENRFDSHIPDSVINFYQPIKTMRI